MWARLLIVGVLGGAIGAVATWYALGDGDNDTNPAPTTGRAYERSVAVPTSAPALRPSLADIVGIAHDFQRNAGLYALLDETNPDEVEALLAEVETLAPTAHRYDIARVIYTRLAEVDPETAADHVVAASYHSSWVAAVFRAWAHADLDAAVDRTATLEGDAKTIAAATILELDLPAWQRAEIADRLDSGMALAAIQVRESVTGAQTDFASAWDSALRAIDLPENPRSFNDTEGLVSALGQLGPLASRWAAHDPAAAMAAVAGVGNANLAMSTQSAVLRVWAADDPSAAIAWLAEHQQDGRGRHGDWLAQVLMRELVQNGVAEAVLALDTMPARLKVPAGIGLASALESRVSDSDFQIVLDWFDALESTNDQLAGQLVRAYAARDVEQAFAWAQTLEGAARRSAVGTAAGELARSDPALAKRLIAEVEDPRLRMDAARRFISTEGRNDPEGALQWARSFPVEEDRARLELQAFSVWSWTSPREAAREVLAMRDTELRDEVAGTIAWSITQNGQVGLAEDLFDAAESESARTRIASALLRYYTDVDPDEDKADFYRGIVPEQMRGSRNGGAVRFFRR